MTNSLSKKNPNEFSSPEVRVVEASAGSGKTYALAKRYVQLLLSQDSTQLRTPTQNILALTFTNKASFEMKERILYFLKGIALGQLSKNDLTNILDPLGMTEKEAQKAAFLIMESIIHHYHFFQVQTIDKFINSLLSGCAFKVGLTANFKIKTTALDYLEYSLDRLIDQASFDKDTLLMFERFLENYLYIENRKGWFPKKDILSVVKSLYDQNNVYGRPYIQSNITPKQLNELKFKILGQMKALEENLPEKTNATFRKSLDKFLRNHHFSFDIDKVPNFSSDEPRLNQGAQASSEVLKLWSAIKQDLQLACQQEAHSLYNPYIEVFEEVMKIFSLKSAKEDVLFLEELNKKAQSLFDEQGLTVEEIYFRLATRLEHYLFDEFQDTNRLQWSNIQMLPGEALSSGGSLFYVGDRKQAIYGFRGGDVDLFDEIKDEFSHFVRQEPLLNNFRSHKAIVEFNNAVFSAQNLHRFIESKERADEERKSDHPVQFADEDYQRLSSIFVTSQQTHRSDYDQGYVKIETIPADGKEESDEWTKIRVKELLSELKNRFEWKDIAFLTRSNSQVESITAWLLEENIPVDSERTSNVKDNLRIAELIYLLKFLNSPIDNVSFAMFLLSELFLKSAGLPYIELESFIIKNRSNLTKQRNFYLYQAFKKEYPELWKEYFEEFYKNIGLFPLYELVISIYEKFNCLNLFESDQGYFMLFLELIHKREEEHSDVSSFFEYFENLSGESLYVQMSGINAVKVMTIHKAKGLEFPVVIVPFLTMDVNVGSRSNESGQTFVLRPGRENIKLLRLKKDYYRYAEELYHIYREEYIKSLFSELNNVYVALTRASHELYAFVPKKVGTSVNPVNYLVPDDKFQSGTKNTYSKTQNKNESLTLTLGGAQYQNWIHYLGDEFLSDDLSHSYEARLQGKIIHFILSNLGNLQGKMIDEEIQKAINKAIHEFGVVNDTENHKNTIRKIILSEDFKKFFYVDVGEVFTEKEIVDGFSQTKRIDRLIVKEKEIWIVDYKASKAGADVYRKQIRQYQKILESIYPKHTIAGYLIYLDNLTLEKIDG
ncbi:MAG: UvrD-helicase domain-containing protein [Candidatus Omnitrophica bacterium]|nr:UvrD-helicase domain-containing protein [Candidatus Omnitrophota bacterium]